jgi:hypothetical protein
LSEILPLKSEFVLYLNAPYSLENITHHIFKYPKLGHILQGHDNLAYACFLKMVMTLYTKFTVEVKGILFSRNSQLLIFAVYIGWKSSELCRLQFVYIIKRNILPPPPPSHVRPKVPWHSCHIEDWLYDVLPGVPVYTKVKVHYYVASDPMNLIMLYLYELHNDAFSRSCYILLNDTVSTE